MNFLKKIIKSAKNFEQHLSAQKSISKNFLTLRNLLSKKVDEPLPVEFFFYSNTESEAKLLLGELEQEGYEVYGIEPSVKNKFSIIGATTPINVNGPEFIKWIERMNELAFLHNCFFDGYGMLIDE